MSFQSFSFADPLDPVAHVADQIGERVEALPVRDADPAFLKALVLVEPVDRAREGLDLEITGLVEQQAQRYVARQAVGGTLVHLYAVAGVVTDVAFDDQLVFDQFPVKFGAEFVRSFLAFRAVFRRQSETVGREQAAQLVRQEVDAGHGRAHGADVQVLVRVRIVGIETLRGQQPQELGRHHLLRIHRVQDNALGFRVGVRDGHIERDSRLRQPFGQPDDAVHRDVAPRVLLPGPEQRGQRGLQLVDGRDVDQRVDRIARPLDVAAVFDGKRARSEILQRKTVAAVRDVVVAVDREIFVPRIDV